MRRLIAVAVAACMGWGIAAPVAIGSDTPYLHKDAARKVAVKDIRAIARQYYLDTSWATGWSSWVEPAKHAQRRSDHKVDFDTTFTLRDNSDGYETTCDIKLRVWRYRDGPNSDLVTDSYVVRAFDPDADCW